MICPKCKREFKFLTHVLNEIVEVKEGGDNQYLVEKTNPVFDGDTYFHDCGQVFRNLGRRSGKTLIYAPSISLSDSPEPSFVE